MIVGACVSGQVSWIVFFRVVKIPPTCREGNEDFSGNKLSGLSDKGTLSAC